MIVDSRGTGGDDLQRLDGKLCAIATGKKGNRTITFKRVFTEFDIRKQQFVLKHCPDAKFEKLVQEKREQRDSKERDRRVITLGVPDDKPSNKFVDQVIELDAIVGVAIQVVRNL